MTPPQQDRPRTPPQQRLSTPPQQRPRVPPRPRPIWLVTGCISAFGDRRPSSEIGINVCFSTRSVIKCIPAFGNGLPCPGDDVGDISPKESVGYRLCSGLQRLTTMLRGWHGRRFHGPVMFRPSTADCQYPETVWTAFLQASRIPAVFRRSAADYQAPGLAWTAFPRTGQLLAALRPSEAD